MEWTLKTYRLDEIERKFDLPCVICVNEGYYSETDAEGFSQGDILSIDSKLVLHKVAANFAFEEVSMQPLDPNYVELTQKEILVPLNYRGKLKVLRDVKNFNSIKELADEFPRYAKVRENMTVSTERNVPVTLQAGTIIELDRIIPGQMAESGRRLPDKLVIQFQHRRDTLVVAVPIDVRGKFRTEQDNNEYTIKEAINRYSLPQTVKFVDDEIKRVYTQDLLEGLENMKSVTAEILQLNRVVTQNVLVGHYKPLDEQETRDTDTERFRHRTLIVLPIDNPEIREIDVNVLKGVTDDIYEEVFLVRNVSNRKTAEIVDGSLYVDFATQPGIKMIQQEDIGNEQEKSEDKPPPRPPKPTYLAQTSQKDKPKSRLGQREADMDDDYVEFKPKEERKALPSNPFRGKPPKKQPVTSTDTDDIPDYEYPDASPTSPGSDYSDYSGGFSLADLNFNVPGGGKSSLKKSSKGKILSNLKSKIKSKASSSGSEVKTVIRKQVTSTEQQRPPIPDPANNDDDSDAELPIYDEVDELKMAHPTPMKSRPPRQTPSGDNRDSRSKPTETKHKPTAFISPTNNQMAGPKTPFKNLNNAELVERLEACGLNEFAEFCSKQNLNGSFFINISKETLSQEMNLTGIPLFKFIQMRDHNWMPS